MKDNRSYIDRVNALRYMGFKNGDPLSIGSVIDDCEKKLCKVMTPRSVYTVKSVGELGDVLIGKDVIDHLEGCSRVVVFAATLGTGVDALIRNYQVSDVARALVADAEASAAIEAYCDDVQRTVSDKIGAKLTSRFSPGYGDLPLEIQSRLLDIADAGRKIGLFANESYILTPSKSVTAFIGIGKSCEDCRDVGCENCDLSENCAYRKEGSQSGS